MDRGWEDFSPSSTRKIIQRSDLIKINLIFFFSFSFSITKQKLGGIKEKVFLIIICQSIGFRCTFVTANIGKHVRATDFGPSRYILDTSPFNHGLIRSGID